jgi:hypothetical protein
MERERCRAIVRAATRLHAAYEKRRRDTNAGATAGLTEQLGYTITQLERAAQCRELAIEREWSAAERHSTARLRRALELLVAQAEGLASRLRDPCPVVPSVRDLYEELVAACDEFDAVELDSPGEIALATEPIWLRDLCFGRFRIVLNLIEMRHSAPEYWYTVEALDPNPAASDSSVTHPHVSKDTLCAGEAANPIRTALLSGRLSEFFLLVRSVLRTYNPGSPYVRLGEWSGITCSDCGYATSEDCGGSCPGCDDFVCDECLRSCAACGVARCRSCLSQSEISDDWVCPDCEAECEGCGRRCANTELENELCEECRKENDDEETADTESDQRGGAEDTDQTAGTPDGAALLGAGVAEAPVPLPPR